MATVVPSDIYQALSRWLETALPKVFKAFSKETGEVEAPEKSLKTKKLKKLEIVQACQDWLSAKLPDASVVDGDLFPALRRFLVVSGLEKTLQALDKAMEGAEPPGKSDKTKKLKKMELLVACQNWLNARMPPPEVEVKKKSPKMSPRLSPKLSPKRKILMMANEDAEGAPKRKKNKAVDPDAPARKSGVPFKRIDEAKMIDSVQDKRLLDNTHLGKAKFGASAGDSWADKASEDMLKVKGKGFRKEMAKKKRASWKGTGVLDQGTNSVQFADWSGSE